MLLSRNKSDSLIRFKPDLPRLQPEEMSECRGMPEEMGATWSYVLGQLASLRLA